MTVHINADQFTFNRLTDTFVTEASDICPPAFGFAIDMPMGKQYLFEFSHREYINEGTDDEEVAAWHYKPAKIDNHCYNVVIFND